MTMYDHCECCDFDEDGNPTCPEGEDGRFHSSPCPEKCSPVVLPSLQECEKALGEPAKAWENRCHETVTKILKAGLVKGRACYGIWTGPCVGGGPYGLRGEQPFYRHGWVELKNGRIFDPTRWVFGGKKPYLYVGPSDCYDEGANGLRIRLETDSASPLTWTGGPLDKPSGVSDHLFSSDEWKAVASLLRLDAADPRSKDREFRLTVGEAAFLANRPPDVLGAHAASIFKAICKAGHLGFIPIDNRVKVLGG